MRLSEIYESVQGEGPNVGQPTVFVRFGGCNLRCPGWGTGTLPDGTVVPGCDTVYAVYPQWRADWKVVEVEEILSQIPEHVGRVCITGGEPLLQTPDRIEELVRQLIKRGHVIDLFTNGSRRLPDWVLLPQVTVVMDVKLIGSGEGDSWTNHWIKNLEQLGEKDALKFVIKDRDDFLEACSILTSWQHMIRCPVYFGPVWDHLSPNTLVEWMMEEPITDGVRINIQTHKYMFGDVRGI